MKQKLIAICLLLAISAVAQTNAVIFQQLLSSTNTVLMTNAEFRCFSGNRMLFQNNAGSRWFHAGDVAPEVLSTLHTTPEQLEARQLALDAAKQKYLDSVDAYQAEQLRQKQSAAIRALIAEADAQKEDQLRRKPHRTTHDSTTERESVGIGAP